MKYQTLVPTATAALLFSAPAQAVLWTAGHGDLGLEGDDGVLEFEVHVGEDDPATVGGMAVSDTGYEPGDIEIAVANRQILNSSDNDLLNGLGILSGDAISILPNSESFSDRLGTPLLGFGLEELNSAEWGDITFALTGVTGPGFFSVYQVDGLGDPNFFMSTALDGITDDDFATLPAGIHDDFNFAFSEEGRYQVTLEASGNYIPDGELRSTTGTFTFAVPEPSSAALLGLGVFGFVLRRRR
jgi:surface-anchored protein